MSSPRIFGGLGDGDPIPPFDEDGVLPEGDYEVTLDALEESRLVTGAGLPEKQARKWDSHWRRKLVRNLRVLVAQLVAIGVNDIFVDGSFVEDKPRPSDIDGYFVIPTHRGEFHKEARERVRQQLAQLDPALWTWDPNARTLDRSTGKKQLPMWHRYHVELFPHIPGAFGGCDDRGNAFELPAFFRMARSTGKHKGIVKLKIGAE
jgi:hypothetical protein